MENRRSDPRDQSSKGPLQARGGGLCGCGQFGLLLSDEALGRIVRLLAHGGLANGLFVTFVDSARRSLSVGPTCVDARSIKEIPRDLSSGVRATSNSKRLNRSSVRLAGDELTFSA